MPPLVDPSAARPFRAGAAGIEVFVRVSPRASRAAIEGIGRGVRGEPLLALAVTAPPDGGRANAAVIALLAETWRLPKSACRIARGETQRTKTVAIAGDPAPLLARLDAWWATFTADAGAAMPGRRPARVPGGGR